MKKIFYLFTAISLIFASCTPLENVYNELDAQGEAPIVGDATFTTTEEDYALTKNEEVEKALAFSSYEQAKELIPTMLTNKYVVWGKGSSAVVTFNYNLLSFISNTVTSYELTKEDYTNLGLKYPNFGSNHQDEAVAFITVKYPDAVRGDIIELTYKYYSGGVNNVTAKFVYTDEWLATQELVEDDYKAMGRRYPNFTNFEDASFKIGRYLGTLPENTYSKAGDVKNIIYAYSYKDDNGVRQSKDILLSYTFNGSSWNAEPNTIKFGHDGKTWIPDNTIKYIFTSDDYATVGNSTTLAEAVLKDDVTMTAQLANLNKYGNFNRTGGSSSWTDEMMLKAIDVALNESIAPNAAEGQKYEVTVNVYNGSNATETFKVIKKSDKWVLQEEK